MILLVRHADTGWVANSGGSTVLADPPLSPRGREQVPYLADFLRERGVRRVFHSPLSRAVETVQSLSINECEPVSWLREIRYPDWRQHASDDVFKLLGQMDSAHAEARWEGWAASGGESLNAYRRTVETGATAFLAELGMRPGSMPSLWRLASPIERVALVGHAGSLSILTALLLGLPPVAWERQRFPVRQASVTEFGPITVGDEVAFGVRSLGKDDFIPTALRSID